MRQLRSGTLAILGLALGTFTAHRAAAEPAWTSTGALPRGFAFHASATLKDGAVLVAGGANDQDQTSVYGDAARWDPSTKTWTALPKLATARASAVAVTLADGRVWIVGGVTGATSATSATELFDPTTKTWASGPALSTPRVGHTATRLPDGKVLVVGGATMDASGSMTLLSTCELFDPVAGALTAAPSLKVARAVHTATLVVNPAAPTVGKLFVAGGGVPPMSGTPLTLSSAESFDTATSKWTTVADMPQPRLGHAAALAGDGSVVVTGGQAATVVNTADVYGVIGLWKTPAPMKTKRSYHNAEGLASGRVLVMGGIDGAAVHSSAEVYDPATESWLATDPMPTGHAAASSNVLPDGSVMIAGGFDALGNPSSAAELFRPAAIGAACANPGSCASGLCVDGVCCDAKCDGQCQACDVAGKVGTCSGVTGQPHGARGKCEPYVCGPTACLAQCSSGADCATGYSCDPKGACVPGSTCSTDRRAQITPDGATLDCSPYMCASDGRCGGVCRSTTDCAPGATCDSNGLCVAPAASGDSGGCAVPSEGSRRAPLALFAAACALGVAIAARRRRG